MSKSWKKLEQSPVWDFAKKPDLEGLLASKKEAVGPNQSMFYNIELPDHSVFGVWGNTVLDDRLAGVQPGQEIKISYKGMVKNEKSGRDYKSFDVFVSDES